MDRLRISTVWLGGCSGCHMSFLDLDEWLIELAGLADLVYSPIIDIKEYPQNVDVCLVEGAVANHDNLELIRIIRKQTKVVVAFGDCAVTGNVTSMRNPLGKAEVVLNRAYMDPSNLHPQIPSDRNVLPVLLDRVLPLHEAVHVDFFLPGCPPPASRIKALLEQVGAGKIPVLTGENIRFG
jgi:NAD-reducing hydrogenase small subunit